MIKLILYFGWSITLLSGGAIAGWNAHDKVSQLQKNPLAVASFLWSR